MAGNFGFSEDFYNYIKNNFQVNYDKVSKMWIFSPLDCYNDVYNYVKERYESRGVDIICIPTFAFTLIENTIPFSDKGEKKFLHRYDYTKDLINKPTLANLPESLFR